jgi:hypothetical protein
VFHYRHRMVAAIVVGMLVLLLAPMWVYDERQRRQGRRVMEGSEYSRWDATRGGASGFGGGGEGGFSGG